MADLLPLVAPGWWPQISAVVWLVVFVLLVLAVFGPSAAKDYEHQARLPLNEE
jgi:hypothetical protein